jgi:formylglycine-generating enzyme required for sulfatase activity
MSAYEITQGQYKAIIGRNPSFFKGLAHDNLPVEQVSWWEAIQCCNALSAKAGLQPCYNESTGDCDFTKSGFRLPTEAEWEYACRAGTTTNYYTGNLESDLARAGWYSSNSSGKTHLVGRKTPNAWGLYDMHGNAWEWCNDWYEGYTSASAVNPTGAQNGSDRVVRGGAWYGGGSGCRSAARAVDPPSGRLGNFGFRVVRRP